MAYEHPTVLTQAGEVDLGLQSYMRKVYNTMAIGLVVTGLTAFGVANTEPLFKFLFTGPMMWVTMLAPLAFLWLGFTPARISRMDAGRITMLFTVFSALMGASMAAIFFVFTAESIARVFFITAATFGAMSLYGYTTRRDLTRMGAFLFMGLIGIFFAALVNMFIQSEAVHFAVSVIGVMVFTGLTAWDTQRLKETYAAGADEANAKVAVMGALSLYLNFVNLFQMLLHLTGSRE